MRRGFYKAVSPPASLGEWFRLNQELDRRIDAVDLSDCWTSEQIHVALDVPFIELEPRIREAWLDASLVDRMKVNWGMLKASWRERIQGME